MENAVVKDSKAETDSCDNGRYVQGLVSILVFMVAVLGFVGGCSVVRDIVRAEVLAEVRSMPEKDMVSTFGRAVQRPEEDFNAVADSLIFRGTGQYGFVTGTVFMLSGFCAAACGVVAWALCREIVKQSTPSKS